MTYRDLLFDITDGIATYTLIGAGTCLYLSPELSLTKATRSADRCTHAGG
jgi:hypothetical protein